MSDTPENQNEEIDVDQLLADIEAPTPPAAEKAPEAPQAAPEAPTWNGSEWEFEVNGKKVFPDSKDKAKIWMSQGYNYSQRMGEFNQTRAQKEAEWKEKEQLLEQLKKYQQIDDYAKQNKDWWEHVENSWQGREKPRLDPALQPILDPIQQKLQQLEQFMTTVQQREQQEQIKQEDQSLDAEIGEIRKQYPTIDLNAVDESGRTLEWRVLNHAAEHGIKRFTTAFRDLLHSQLVELAKAEGREAVAKDKEKQARSGILGKTQVPTKGIQPTANVKGKSYGDITNEILQELGISN